jgi:hypothetical protein
MKAERGNRLQLYSSESRWGKETHYPLYRRLGGPQGRSGWVQKISPPGLGPWTVQSVVSRYTNYAIPVHRTGDTTVKYYFRECRTGVWCTFKLHRFQRNMSWNMDARLTHFLAHSKNRYKKWLLACSYLFIYACLSTWNSTTPTGEISMKFHIWGFY